MWPLTDGNNGNYDGVDALTREREQIASGEPVTEGDVQDRENRDSQAAGVAIPAGTRLTDVFPDGIGVGR